MDYRDFVEQVKEQIRDYLPEKFRNAEISVHEVIKNNDCRLDGLSIRTEESNVSPTIYLNPYYAKLQDGAEMEDILTAIADFYQDHYVDQKMDIDKIMDYDNVKDRIICKLINEEANRDYLKNKPYTKVEDLAVMYQILIENNDYEISAIALTNRLMERFGVSLEELHEKAIENTENQQHHSFHPLREIMKEEMVKMIAVNDGVSMDEAEKFVTEMMQKEPEKMYALSNYSKVNGAAVILNDDVRQEIASKIGNFYILPSSIHETIIVPKDLGLDLRELEKTVIEANRTAVAQDEVLSDHVYEYDAQSHELFRTDKAQERMNTRSQGKEEKKERNSLQARLGEKKNEVAKLGSGDKEPAVTKKREASL